VEKNEGSATVSSSMTDFDGDGQPDTTDPDDDNDGMPDLYEQQYGLLAFLNDASLDKDGDGLTNLEELQIGTSPADPDSVLKATLSYTTGEPAAQLTWHGAAGRQYEVQGAYILTLADGVEFDPVRRVEAAERKIEGRRLEAAGTANGCLTWPERWPSCLP